MQCKEAGMEDELFRIGNLYCGVWCRSTKYSSYDNVYAVNLGKHGDEFLMRVHKVVGTLANGNSFAGFLIDSLNVAGAATTLSHAYNECRGDLPRLRDWVVVTAESFCGVYFASNGNGCVKVGQTTYPLRTRIAQIQAGSPHRLYVCATITTGDRRVIEKQIHKSLAGLRLHGEWFTMTDDEAIAIAKQYGGHQVQQGSNERTTFSSC
jgi:hypothetical protein